MLRADALTVVHHDDTTSEFTDVHYALDRAGLRVVTAGGHEQRFPGHDILTTHVHLTHRRGRPEDSVDGWAGERRTGERRRADRRMGDRHADERRADDRRTGDRRASSDAA